jgi:hypothetical protein
MPTISPMSSSGSGSGVKASSSTVLSSGITNSLSPMAGMPRASSSAEDGSHEVEFTLDLVDRGAGGFEPAKQISRAPTAADRIGHRALAPQAEDADLEAVFLEGLLDPVAHGIEALRANLLIIQEEHALVKVLFEDHGEPVRSYRLVLPESVRIPPAASGG